MLEQLHIKNYALAENLTVEFESGFNILSGETGSGKSVIIGALSLVAGEKADVSMIRTGESETEVSAVVNITGNKDAQNWLQEHELEADDGRVIIRRVLKNTGRGSLTIQSTPVVKNDVKAFSSLLFDIHGQHEHQSLLSSDNHLKILDSFAGLDSEVELFKKDFIQLNTLKKDFQKLVSDERELARESDIASFAIKEIEEANLKPGEIEKLEEEHRLLSQAEKLFILFEQLHECLSESAGGAVSGLRSGVEYLKELAGIDSEFNEALGRIENVFYETEDILDGIESYKNNFDYSPERLADCEERLSSLLRLRKKYGDTVEEIFEYLEECRHKVETVENSEEIKEEYRKNISELEKKVLDKAGYISAERKKSAIKLQAAIQEQLKKLGMPKAVFEVLVEQRIGDNGKPSCGFNGFDAVEFLISPNQGEPPKKLKNIASGGEISRVMLSIKTIIAEVDTVGCLVFDEIDSGIGGEIAVAVAEHMYNLSRYKQILCITHLASIAVRADNHIRVSKKTVNNRTYTEISSISGDERTREIARMLSGDTNADVSLKHAEDLLLKAVVARKEG